MLFTSYEGSFEDGSLVITCQDLYPMDLGSATFTDFKMDESVAGYIAENFDLFACDMNLIHSHNQMAAFFSGTDTSTLQSEGNDQNCFVSLIVNNAGKYCAAVTRKVKEKKTIVTKDYKSVYDFFGEGEKNTNKILAGGPTETVVDNTYIEYFDLDVQIEPVDNPLAYLDTRFEEIEAKKRVTIVPPVVKASPNGNISPWIPGGDFDKDYSFCDWQKQRGQKTEQPTLFPQEEMEAIVDVTGWEPDPTIIHRLVCQMITCSLIVNQDIDLKQWITRWMDKKYREIFGSGCNESPQFSEWKKFIVEFMITQYTLSEDDIPGQFYDDFDLLQSKVAGAMYAELYQYDPKEENEYIKEYMDVLTRYIYE